MTESSTNKPPVWFWIVSVIAFIWNGMGIMVYLAQAYMTEDDIKALPEAQQALYADIPAWATAAFAIAVWAGLLGCIALLLRKRWAKLILLVSLIGIVVQMFYNLVISNAMDVYGLGGAIMPIMVLIIGVSLIRFSNLAIAKNWIS